MEAWTILLVQDEAIKDGEHLLTVGTDAAKVVPEASLKVPCFHPLLNHGMGNVNILSEGVYIMPAEEEAVEEGSFPLWRQGVEIVSRRHKRLSENVSIPMPRTIRQVRRNRGC